MYKKCLNWQNQNAAKQSNQKIRCSNSGMIYKRITVSEKDKLKDASKKKKSSKGLKDKRRNESWNKRKLNLSWLKQNYRRLEIVKKRSDLPKKKSPKSKKLCASMSKRQRYKRKNLEYETYMVLKRQNKKKFSSLSKFSLASMKTILKYKQLE